MGALTTIILFFIYTWGLGFTATKFLKQPKSAWEANLMRIGIGLGIFPVLIVLLNLLHIPLDWKIFLALSLIVPLYSLAIAAKNKQLAFPTKFKLTKSQIYILVVLFIFLATFFMMHKGAFTYPYLEDDDPWDHAKGIKFVSLEKTVDTPAHFEGERFFYYMDPYPPGYEALQGVLHQTNDSISWSMKFFNALIISLGTIFFFFFAKEFMRNSKKALFSTFALAMIPCFLTHFIWAHSLVVVLFFPAMYCLERIKYDKKWIYVSAIVIAAIPLTQPTQAVKLAIMLALYFGIKSILTKKIQWNLVLPNIYAAILSVMWWTPSKIKAMWFTQKTTTGTLTELGKRLAESGTATRAYNFGDYFIAKSQGLINNPVGIGIFLSILLIAALVWCVVKYKKLLEKKNHWIIISLAWLIFTFIGMNTVTFNLPIGFFAFRFWMLFAIPVSLLASQGAWYLARLGKKVGISKGIIFAVLIIGIIATSGYQKYTLNTAMWPPGGKWTSTEELQGYTWLKTLPPNTKVFDLQTKGDKVVIGFDKFSCAWCEEVQEFRAGIIDVNVTSLHSWLKRNKYEYLIIGGMSYKYLGRQFGENKTKEILPQLTEDVVSSGKFSIAHQTKGMILFKVL